MSVNVKNNKCGGCKYAGVFLCTNSTKCVDNSLFAIGENVKVTVTQIPSANAIEGSKIRENVYNEIIKNDSKDNVFSIKLPNDYKDFFAQGVFSLSNDGRYYLYGENDSVHKFILSFDKYGNYYSVPLKDYHSREFVYSSNFMFKGYVHGDCVLDILNYDKDFTEAFINILTSYKDVILRGLKFKSYCLFADGEVDVNSSFLLSKETDIGNGYTIKVFCNSYCTIVAMPVYNFDRDLLFTDRLPKVTPSGKSIVLEFK